MADRMFITGIIIKWEINVWDAHRIKKRKPTIAKCLPISISFGHKISLMFYQLSCSKAKSLTFK